MDIARLFLIVDRQTYIHTLDIPRGAFTPKKTLILHSSGNLSNVIKYFTLVLPLGKLMPYVDNMDVTSSAI
jgi:hypothetical protein